MIVETLYYDTLYCLNLGLLPFINQVTWSDHMDNLVHYCRQGVVAEYGGHINLLK
jgi:hypothetical protein